LNKKFIIIIIVIIIIIIKFIVLMESKDYERHSDTITIPPAHVAYAVTIAYPFGCSRGLPHVHPTSPHQAGVFTRGEGVGEFVMATKWLNTI
jgi:hypothetical protein